jgi:phosphoenolpyruvate synthase/pyruvate phosphate dikinase
MTALTTDYVLGFGEIDQTQVAVVGGKGAQLGKLSRIDGVRVPAWLLCDDGRVRADHGGSAVDR